MAKLFIANIPVWHRGLVLFFESLSLKDRVIVIGREIAQGIGGEYEDERRLPDEECVRVAKRHLWSTITLLTLKNIKKIRSGPELEIVATDDEVTKRVVETIFPNAKATWAKLFKEDGPPNSKAKTTLYDETSSSEYHWQWMRVAEKEAKKSPLVDLHSGAVLVSATGEPIGKTGIRHLPNEFEPFLFEDGRLSIIHPVMLLIALSGRNGKSLLGSTLFSIDFPCMACAKIIAIAGIKQVIVEEGNKPRSAEILRAYKVKIIKLERAHQND
ncbi:MAG: hypothetical protein EXS49_01100 [Candidatus Pacebacteria bacterium]|nr:hypothetical protein [Candidatus Paceibacterota bacterium]